ncbi:hypothetical protein BDV95DRAFT_568841 [Massariosphaeria phaeospora]|uniref:BHLH domain-containing protein n=1 Tax=Massariosphaeria phaeospora TaxID=100035 RepID=A0A7C8ME75_9PLEO|nr:hypothetical protein BDV95DRAFT_568841 [Massariosphaeria phaeospora]
MFSNAIPTDINLPSYPKADNSDQLSTNELLLYPDAVHNFYAYDDAFDPATTQAGMLPLQSGSSINPGSDWLSFANIMPYEMANHIICWDPSHLVVPRVASLTDSIGSDILPPSPPISPVSAPLKHDPLAYIDMRSDVESPPKVPRRKRGRPRRSRSGTHNSDVSRKERQPHNLVERRYRDGLNGELERLRRAIPTLFQSKDFDNMGSPRLSKAMVLASGIEYIKTLERERDDAREEVRKVRGNTD